MEFDGGENGISK
jgi:hypothetical protein